MREKRRHANLQLMWELGEINNKLDEILRKLEDETNSV